MKQSTLLLLFFISFCCLHTAAQNVGIGTSTPNAAAQLDITSTTKGLLLPRLTQTQRDAITTPVVGLIIYNTSTNSFQYYRGPDWSNITHSGIASGVVNRIPKFAGAFGMVNSQVSDNGVGVSINTTGTAAHASALLDLSSTSKGILIPRMTTAERTAIASPATGLMVYDNNSNNFWFYNGTSWAAINTGSGSSPWTANGNNIYNNNSGYVGIGTSTPTARLHVVDSNVVFVVEHQNPTPANPPVQGQGRRMMWYSDKGAFRAGQVTSDEWDKDNIGDRSFAVGHNTIASGEVSTAMGLGTVASGFRSTAFGSGNNATGAYATVMGSFTNATGGASTAMGAGTTASGAAATAMGNQTDATGDYSTAMGYQTLAGGEASTAMGWTATASGNYSTAIGNHVSTNNQNGSFVIGDNSTGTVMTSANINNFRARFSGGYKLFTSSDLSIGCTLFAGDNAWTTGSDVRSKENFAEVNGEDFLKKIAGFHLTSWNYKTQNPATFRHYGPMAQDFHAAFGRDQYGSIGNDTTINSADFAGVSFIAIQALEKRSSLQQQKMEAENNLLKGEMEKLKTIITQLQKEVEKLSGK